MLLLLALCCHPPEKAPGEDSPPDDSPRDDSPRDDSPQDQTELDLNITTDDGQDGAVVLRFTPTTGETPLQFTLSTGEHQLRLPPGQYGLRAWRDDDGDGQWGGAWAPSPEPTALLGLELPRAPLQLPLRAGPPEPILGDAPEWVSLYGAALGLARQHIARGTPENGFADAYLDEAFSEQLFQWDTCFMALFGLHDLDELPVMESLDNFYATQRADGYICRVVNESDGQPGGDASDPSEPMINPPLFATAELAYVRRTGDLSRLERVFPVLDAYADWIDANLRTGPGLYYTSLLGSGMDNAPRDAAYDAWVDLSAQQALARRDLAALATLRGDAAGAAAQAAEHERICADLAATWDEEGGWFFDLDAEGRPLGEKTLAGLWPLVAGCADDAQAARVVDALTDPGAFWRVHPFASTAADAPSFDPDGHYWRGGVWAPTNYAAALALSAYGRRDIAREATARQLDVLWAVYAGFEAESGQLAEAGDGRNTLWELYAPDQLSPGTRWDDQYLGRQDFVGWTGLIPIAGLFEQALGFSPDATTDTLTWHLGRADAHGARGYRFGDQLIDLEIGARSGDSDGGLIQVSSSDPFTLVVERAGIEASFAVPAGTSALTLDPLTGARAAALVPAGPFPGYAVLGNGQIAAIYSDDDGSGDPPGVLHLYVGDHATDLIEVGQTLVGQAGSRRAPARVGLDPFFAAYAELPLEGGVALWRSFAAADRPALVTEGAIVSNSATIEAVVAPLFQVRENLHLDGGLSLRALSRDGEVLLAELSDGRALALAMSPAPEHYELGEVVADPVAGGLRDQAGPGRQLALSATITAAAGGEAPFRHVLAVGGSPAEAAALARELLADPDPAGDAAAAWADLAPGTLCAGPACPIAAANLAAAAASALGGAVPADMTGQFVTNDRPQLYPRDAAMVARALLRVGRREAALEIVRYWLDPAITGPNPGEWYARYDALGRGVDAGSGAAYDTPEWDFNAYLALLVEDLGGDSLSAAERERVLSGLDFLVTNQDAEGLWTEGGIVEWVGRLPSTAMIAWAGLDAGARLADAWGEPARAAQYRAAAGRARGGLYALIDELHPVLSSERSGLMMWDSSMFFGPLLGYPADPALELSWAWLRDNARAHGGGVRYFEDPWGGTGSYGQDLFYFTTAAALGFARALDDPEAAWLEDWMRAMTNVYGLAPERVYADGRGAAEASPLSWCAAELGLALLDPGESFASDGEISALELRPGGFSAVDHDGAGDLAASPVALYARSEAGTLRAALRLAGPAESGRYTLWLSGEDGLGPLGELSFRAEPGAEPGAVAWIDLDLDAGTCVAEAADGAVQACASLAAGRHGVELEIDLAPLGLSPPVQVIAEYEGELLPANGSLSTGGFDDTVLLRFIVDAPGVPGAVTLSGDRAELGAWAGDAIGLEPLGGGLWSWTVRVERGGFVAYKYLTGTPGDGSWAGVEFGGEDRTLRVEDLDGSGRVEVFDTFGVRGGVVLDP